MVPNAALSQANSDVDRAVERVARNAAAFAALNLNQRIALAESMRHGLRAQAEAMVLAACEAKHIKKGSALEGEEWLSGPGVSIRHLRLLIETMKDIARRKPLRMTKTRTLTNGRMAGQVFPLGALDGFVLPLSKGEVYFQEGVTKDNLENHYASFYKKPHQGGVCAVLGAGNVNAIPAMDVFSKMFTDGQVCVLKTSPVNAYLKPIFKKAFAAAYDAGFLEIVDGGAEEGARLIHHPDVDEVHITGSDKTYDVMVWGSTKTEQEKNKANNTPVLKKKVSAELGNISPTIVVPGPYSDAELWYQARNVAGMICHNASFDCNATKLIITAKEWSERDRFLDLVMKALDEAPQRGAYYPGAKDRYDAFTEGRSVRRSTDYGGHHLPYAMVSVEAMNTERMLNDEPWCSVFSQTALKGEGPDGFLKNAVDFVNQQVWGNLCASMIIHPRTQQEFKSTYEQALIDMRYGAVGVNTWPGAIFGLGSMPWGAYPGATPKNIQSGVGWVHNGLMLESIEKCVLHSPIRGMPLYWFPKHESLRELGMKFVDYELARRWHKLPTLAWHALRGA